MKEIIYVYTTDTYKSKNWYKIGETTQEASVRISQQDTTSNPEELKKLYELDITNLTDMTAYEVEQKIHQHYGPEKRVRDRREWFEVENGVEDIKKVIESILDNSDIHKSEIILKPHQVEADKKIDECFNSNDKKCLLAHKPRSGKTYIATNHIRKNAYKNTLILTSYPILNHQWSETISNSKGFSDFEIIIGSEVDEIKLSKNKNSILLLSLQDVKGGDEVFGKDKFKNIKDIIFDIVLIDEVHYGVETLKTDEFFKKLNYERILGLSATPTKNLICGRFSNDQIHSYNLSEENKLKNLYPDLYPYPKINFLLWNLSQEEKNNLKYFKEEEGFKFDKFFRIENDDFYYKSDVIYLFKKLIGDKDTCKRDKLGTSYPFKNSGMFSSVRTILLYLPNISAQYKLKEILEELESYDDFNIHITNSQEYSSKKLMNKIKRDFKSGDKRSLIIAVDQLTTGITLDDCDMVSFMNDTKSMDKYIQTSFRPQSPKKGKLNCWVLDLNAARSVRLLFEYTKVITLNNNKSLTQNVSEFVECVNIFNRIEGEFKEVDVDGFNQEYMKSILERPRFNQNAIFIDRISDKSMISALLNFGLGGGSQSDITQKLNPDGIDSGKTKTTEKTSSKESEKVDKNESKKYLEIAKDILDKTMLLPIFTNFKYDNIDDCLFNLETDQTIVYGTDKTKKQMYLEVLSTGSNHLINFDDVKFIYNNLFDKSIIDKKIYIFNQNVNLIYNNIRENPSDIIMQKNLIELIDSYLKPSNTEKKMLGEVFTSLDLVGKMLDKIPSGIWSNPNLKWLDPANGIGNFPILIIERLMIGLKEWQPDDELRLKHILENMIYVCELQSKNMFIYLQLFDSENKYNLNFYRGSFLDEGFSKALKNWGIEKFDIVIGNPPYNAGQKAKGKRGGGENLWDQFVIKVLNLYLKEKGYLLFVHPTLWRKPQSEKSASREVNELMMKKQIHYLECHDSNDGKKTFNAGTRYDFYLLENCELYTETLINDEDRKDTKVNLKNYNFIPNSGLSLFDKLVAKNDEKTCNVIFNRTNYGTDKDWVSKDKNEQFKYELVHSTPKSGTRWMYSSRNDNGHFGIPKVIFGDSGIYDVIIDFEGKYGMTQHSMALVVSSIEEAQNIKKALMSDKFNEFLKSVMWSNFQIDWRLFMYLKKYFWKEFID
jgi:superfamily II DNA or RNA helicase